MSVPAGAPTRKGNGNSMANETMLAVRAYGPHDYRIETIARPVPGPGEILVKVGAAGICASDMKCFSGGELFWGADGSGGFCEAPVTPGHEFAGMVSELGVGAEHHGVVVGDHVTAEQIIPCGRCRFCQDGHYWMCEPHNTFGFKGKIGEGAMAEYMIFPVMARVHKLPQAMPWREAAYVEPLACAIHAVDRGDLRPGDTVVVAGVGNIGLCALQAVRRFNPGRVIALDTKPDRLELALSLGADVAINPLEEDAAARVKSLTDGYGCDVYIEITGSAQAPQQGLDMIRRLGTVVAFSVNNERSTIDWNLVGDQKELNIHGAHLSPYTYPVAISAIADGTINVKPLISAEYPIEEFEAAMAAARGGNLKTLIVPR